MRFRGGFAIFVAALALAPATASAAIRYTSPTGSGSACTQVAPCSLVDGVNGAVAGDEVRLAADEYNLTSQLAITVPNLTISGPPGRYTPDQFQAFMIFSGASTTATNILVQADGFTLRRVSVSGQSGNQIVINSTTADDMELDRVRIFDGGSAGTVVGQSALIRNSIIRQDPSPVGASAVNITGAILGSTITSATRTAIINDDNFHIPPDYCALQVINTIAIGAVSNLAAVDGGSGCDPTIVHGYSWIPAAAGFGGGGIAPSPFIISSEGNLPDGPPALSAPLSGDIALALDSPAINTGCGGSCGIEDFYGRPRPIGAGNDIGAIETILLPSISTVGVDAASSDSASVSATINPNGGATTYNFAVRKVGDSDWAYFSGGTTGEGADVGTVSGQTGGNALQPSTDYEIRLEGTNAAGSSASPAITRFRTSASPGTISVSGLKAKVGKKSAFLTSRVRVSAAGSLRQEATTGSGRKKKTWCRTMTTARGASTYTLKCNLGSKGRRYLKKRSLALTVVTTLRSAFGPAATSSRKLTVKRKR